MNEQVLRDMFLAAHSAILNLYSQIPDPYTFEGRTWHKLDQDGLPWLIADGPLEDSTMVPLEFGTTAVIAIKWGSVLIIAHTGDSKCVVGQVYGDGNHGRNGFLGLGTIEMTIDHTIGNEIEQSRIAALPEQPTQKEDGYISIPYGE